MDNPHSCMFKVHLITTRYSFSINTLYSRIFSDMVFPFRWSTMELIGMFHDLLALLKECVPFSTTSIATSNISSIHMLLSVFGSTQFNYGVDILFCGLGIRGRFSLLFASFATCKSNMLLHFLWGTIKFMIIYFFLVLASSNLVECVLASLMVCLFLPYKQPKNPKNVVNLEILL